MAALSWRPFIRPFTPPSQASSCYMDGHDVVSSRKSTFDRVIAKILRRSVVSKGVSDAAKDKKEPGKMETLRRSERLKMKRDRLSGLPNAIMLHIMSFLMIKDVVKTSVLSKRWKNLWKSLPNLTLHTSDFSKPWFFVECVSVIVSSRRGNYPLRTLDFNRHGYFKPRIFIDLINHVVSHGVQQLNIVVPYNLGLPYCVFSCHSLTSLYISASTYDFKRRTRLPRYLDLPALRSLHLEDVAISADDNGHAEPFSTCDKLNNLYIDNCDLIYPSSLSSVVEGILNITNATLVSLTIHDTSALSYKAGIAIPKYKYVISTTGLCSFTVNDSPFRAPAIPEWLKIELQSSSLMTDVEGDIRVVSR